VHVVLSSSEATPYGKRPHYTESQMYYSTKGTRAHTHRELIREWLWKLKGSSSEAHYNNTESNLAILEVETEEILGEGGGVVHAVLTCLLRGHPLL